MEMLVSLTAEIAWVSKIVRRHLESAKRVVIATGMDRSAIFVSIKGDTFCIRTKVPPSNPFGENRFCIVKHKPPSLFQPVPSGRLVAPVTTSAVTVPTAPPVIPPRGRVLMAVNRATCRNDAT